MSKTVARDTNYSPITTWSETGTWHIKWPNRKVFRAQQLSINIKVHINWLHAHNAGCGWPVSSINSALSSSAAVQTWINGVINLAIFQMYDFSTSIPSPFPAGYWCPPPQISFPCRLSSLTSTPRWIACHFINPRFGNLWCKMILQNSKNAGGATNSCPSHHTTEMNAICIWAGTQLENVRFRCHNTSKCVSVIHQPTPTHILCSFLDIFITLLPKCYNN